MNRDMETLTSRDANPTDKPGEQGVAPPKAEMGTFWRNRNIAGVELFHGNFLEYSFTRHFHSVAAFGAVESGAMRSWHRDSNHTLARGTVMRTSRVRLQNP